MVALQRSAGNAAVARLLRQVAPPGAPAAAGKAPARTLTRDAAPAAPAAPAATGGALLVADDAAPVPGGMRRGEFLDQVEQSVCALAEAELAGTVYQAAGCPWIEHWIGYYRNRSAEDVEAAVRRYAPEAASAQSVDGYVTAIGERVRSGIAEWRQTGEAPAIPEGAPEGGPARHAAAAPPAAGKASVAREADDSPGGGLLPAGAPPEAAQLGAGRPLDGGVASRLGPGLGGQAASVRVHDDGAGAALAGRMGASAVAFGSDIAFAPNMYEPGTLVGDALIAHELAHVGQQAGGGELAVAPEAAAEADADQATVGVLARLYAGSSELARRLAREAKPAVRSGLALRSCGPMPDEYEEKEPWIWTKTGDNSIYQLPGNLTLEQPPEITPKGSRFVFDADGDQRKEMEALIKVAEPTATSGSKRSVHIELTQISSSFKHTADLVFPDMGNPLPAPALTAVTDGRHPTEFSISDMLAVRVHPGSLVGNFGTIFIVDVGEPNSDNGQVSDDPALFSFGAEAQGPQSVFSTKPPGGDPDAKEVKPIETGDIWSLDVGVGAHGDRFRLSFRPNDENNTVIFGLGVLSDGEPVAGERTTLFLKNSLDVKILSNVGAELSLDLDGDGREDLALFDRLSVPTQEELEAEDGRDPALVALRSPSLYRDHHIFAEGSALSTERTWYFPVREGMIRAGSAKGTAENRAAASDLRAVTGLAEQRDVGTFDGKQGQLLGELAYIDRMLIGLRQTALDEDLISLTLFKAWHVLSQDFIILEALRHSKDGVPTSWQDDLATHATAFHGALYAETPTDESFIGGYSTSNAYTGDYFTASEGVVLFSEPGKEFVGQIKSSSWDAATKSYRKMVGGLDRWIAHKNTVKYGDPDLTKPETMRAPVSEHLIAQRAELEDMAAKKPTRVSAVLHPDEPYDETGRIQELPLSLYFWKSGGYWRIKDLSRPDDMPTWTLEVAEGHEALTEPPDALFEKLDEGPHFPLGRIHWMLPSGRGRVVRTSGPSSARIWAMAIAGGAAAIGIGLVTFGAGTVAVVGGYILAGSAILGAGMAAQDLLQRIDHDNLTTSAFLLDVAQIVSAFTGLGALRAGQILIGARTAAAGGALVEASAAVQWANRAFIPLRAANLGADTLMLAVMSADLEKQVKVIQNSGAPDDEKAKAYSMLFAQFALTAGLTGLAVKGAIPELTAGRSLSIEVVNGVQYAIPAGAPSVQGRAVNKTRSALDSGDPATAATRRMEHLANIRKEIPGPPGEALADIELMALRPSGEGQLSVDPTGAVNRVDTPDGTLDDLLAKVTRANNAAAAHGVGSEYSIRIQPQGADGRSPVQVIASPRAGGDAAAVSKGVIRQYLSSQTGRTQAVGDALKRLRGLDSSSRIEVLPDGQLQLNGQIEIDSARIGDIGAGKRTTPPTAKKIGIPGEPLGEFDLRTLLQGTRELDARGGDIARLKTDLPKLAEALQGLGNTGAYRLRAKFHSQLASEWAGTLTLPAPQRAALDSLVSKADDAAKGRLFDIPNEGTPRGGKEVKQTETQSQLASWALDQKPKDLHEFVAQYQYVRAEFYRRVKALENEVEALMASAKIDQVAARQRKGFGGKDADGKAQPPNADELVWKQLTEPATMADLGTQWGKSLAVVKGHTGGVELPLGANRGPVPPTDAEMITVLKKLGKVPMEDDATAAYHTHKHHWELPKGEQYDAKASNPKINSEFDAYMEAAWETIRNPKATTSMATQDGTGRVITFERDMVKPDGTKQTGRALVLVGYDGRATLLTFMPGK